MSKVLIAERLTWWQHPNTGVAYELWCTPNLPGNKLYHLHFVSRGVVINKHGYTSEMLARKDFERRVEALTYAEGR